MNLLIIFIAKYLYLLPIAYLGFILIFSKFRKKIVKVSLLAFPIALTLTKLLGYITNDPRPFVVEHIQPLITHAADNGFPSDHTVLTMTIAVIIFSFNKRFGVVLAFISVIIGISRVLAKVHHPIDIIGGIGVAMVSVAFSWYILKKLNILDGKIM